MKVVAIGIIFCLAGAAGYAAEPALKATRPPDVFLITIDTLRADHVHCYGYDRIQTPALDGLAKDGIRFARAFTPSPVTNTSHATILTGLLPSSHGVTDFAVPLAATHPTLAELLKEQGYRTAAFIGAVILDSNSLAPGFDRGFDFYDNFPDPPQTKSRWGRLERRGMDVVLRAETWLNANPAGPHFVWVHLYDPHDPYEPPPPYSQIYKDHLYDGEIAYADSALEDFVKYLKKRGWYENSLIIAVGDHGEGLGEHNEDTHGIFLYDSTTHIPLIVKLPGSADAGRVVDAQVRTTDILPTVIDLLHASAPPRLDGESLRPYFAGASLAGRTAFGETDYPLHFGWSPLRSVRAEGFKFIQAPRPELYDLQTDPGELKNIYRPQDADVKKLRAILAGLPAESSTPAAGAGSQLPDPKDGIEQQNLLHAAMMAMEESRMDQALELLKRVLTLNPKSLIALRQLGDLEFRTGQYEKAAEYLKSARQIQPGDAAVAFQEGQAFEKTGDLPEAREALEASLKLVPEQFPAQLLLGRIYLRLKNAAAAEDQFEAALFLEPHSVEAQLGAAQAQIAEGSFTDAVRQLEHLLKAHPGNVEAFQLLDRAYSGMGKNGEAERARSTALLLERNRRAAP